jgi:starch-binding outer membrane protein, SusD/RagB family
MKKILFYVSLVVLTGLSCKKNFLDVQSPSSVDEDFVFSSTGETYKVMVGMYEIWRGANNALHYAIEIPGSDAETHPEAFAAQTRHVWESLFPTEPNKDEANFVDTWAAWYKIANRANIIMEALGKKQEYLDATSKSLPNDWTQLYGEAAVFRAYAYHQLVRYFGDVPYFTTTIRTASQTDSAKLISRDVIYQGEIDNLIRVAPLMYRLGQGGINAERFSRTFAEALIGKMALFAGGYSTRRTDFNYSPSTFTQKGIEMWNAKYVRLTDYLKFYQIAKTYLKAVIDNPGSAQLITTDARGANFNNPFQRNFQYNMDLQVSPESLYEIGETQAQFSERPYAFGRPSGGGGANAYPCKSYGQSRLHAAYYYGDFDPADLRRDVTVAVTANSGACKETIIDFSPGSRNLGGLPLNKWDESRMTNPYTAAQRASGINWPMLRMSDVILMLAETYAELGDDAAAKTELTKVRNRAFLVADQPTKVTAYIAGLSGNSLKDAIYMERKLELAGEGILRYDLIRTGKFPQAMKTIRDQQTAMVNGLKTNGYYTFANGNQISKYIYVKAVDVGTLGMTKMLTTLCTVPSTDPTYPVRFPGWRGNCDLWGASGFTGTSGTRNLAIQGLFNYIDPSGAQAAALVTQGYVKTNWGINMTGANEAQYTSYIFYGYSDALYAAGAPPRYILPLSSETVSKSNGLITNGYGFQ